MYYNYSWMIGDGEVSVVSGEEMEKNHAAYGIYGTIIPFNEIMSIGNPKADFLSTQYIEERLCSLNISFLIYNVKILSKIALIPKNRPVHLVFGYDMVCSINLLSLLGMLDYKGYTNEFYIHILDEDTMKEKEYYRLFSKGFYELYLLNIVSKIKTLTPINSINNSLDKYYLYKSHDKFELLQMLNDYDEPIEALKKHREYGLSKDEWQKWLDSISDK